MMAFLHAKPDIYIEYFIRRDGVFIAGRRANMSIELYV
jgi:hypothetical protein